MKRLFIMRHAIAEDREDFAKTGLPDNERPLTSDGIDKLRHIAKKIDKLDLQIRVIAQSPLTRSQQTAEVVAQYLKRAQIITLRSLQPDSSLPSLIKDLNDVDSDTVLIIGHEDHLSRFAMYLLTGKDHFDFLKFKKAGIASFAFENSIAAGEAHLEWLLTPKLTIAL